MFRRCVCFLLFTSVFKVASCWAVDADYVSVIQNLNFGTFIQTSENAQIVLDYNGAVSSSSGITLLKNGNEARLEYEAGRWSAAHRIYMPEDLSLTLNANGCSILIHNFSFSASSLYFIIAGATDEVSVGATLDIQGWCKGSNGSLVDTPFTATQIIAPTANLGYNVETANLQINFTIEEKISITNIQDLNFGSMMSPSSNSSVTISLDGQRLSTGGIYLMENASVTNGLFIIDGQIGRTVYINLPDKVLIYSEYGDTLTVDNFISNKGSSFVLDANSVDAYIGATLTVPRNAAEGNYSGTYTVTVSY